MGFWADLARRQVAYDEILGASGYRELGPFKKLAIIYRHTDYGQMMSSPYTHDQACPANDHGRTTPRLPERTKWGRPA
jgi:hypothetical protein